MTLLEVPVDSVATFEAARAGGASRLELCANLDLDGLTPRPDLVRRALEPVGRIPAFAMVRPRAGDFHYDAREVEGMCADVERLAATGVDGIVTGALTADDRIDVPATARLVAAAGTLPVTFHRAFDRVGDPLAGLDELVALGVRRVLTSGGAATAWEGRATIKKLVERSAGRILVLPGGGVRLDHAAALVEETGALEIHSSTPFVLTPRPAGGSGLDPAGGQSSPR